MRAQAEVVSSVILMAIVLISIAVAYSWGLPMISKAGDASRIEYVQDVFERAGEAMNRIARDGGQSSVRIRSDSGTFRIIKDQIGEYVLVYSLSSRAQFFAGDERPLTDTTSPYKREEAWLNGSAGFTGCVNELTTCGGCCNIGNFTSAYELRDPLNIPDNSYFCISGVEYYLCIHQGAFANFTEGEKIGDSGYTVSMLDGGVGLVQVEGRYVTSVGLIGVNKPAVVLGASVPKGGEFQTVLKLKTRRMLDPSSNELVEIKMVPMPGSSTVSEGGFQLSMKKADEMLRTDPESGRLIRTIELEVGFNR